MHTLNRALEREIVAADGSYLDDQQALRLLDAYVETYPTRLQVYQLLSAHSSRLVSYAVQRWGQRFPDLLARHQARCQYDMMSVLRMAALAVLRDDEIMFREQILVWLDTVLVAHRHTASCAIAYEQLQAAITAALPAPQASLLQPYLATVVRALKSHV